MLHVFLVGLLCNAASSLGHFQGAGAYQEILQRSMEFLFLFCSKKSLHVILPHPALPKGMTRGEYQHLD